MAERQEKVRLFFALWPDDALRAALEERLALLPDPGPKARRLGRQLYHLTLLFLGNVPVPALDAACGLDVGGIPFRIVIDRAGSFRRAQVWWLGASVKPPALDVLWLDLRKAAGAAGLTFDDRPLAPHITCIRHATKYLRPLPIEPIDWDVDSMVLVRSRHGPDGSRYEVIKSWPLAGPPTK